MSSTSRAWIAAASVGAVEALKDQGFCRWNYTMRSVHHHAKASLRSFFQAKNLSSPAPAAAASASRVRGGEEANQSEESLRKVMSGCCKTDARSDLIFDGQRNQVEVGNILRVSFLDPECPKAILAFMFLKTGILSAGAEVYYLDGTYVPPPGNLAFLINA
ncbi:hypothetical protein RHMOL_Rhmol06G0214600 [Rhododendron molle]|uniref:Uncharacterized protein n=1 Tax=Rhododendron molle TaxID=49168 RepID=A0ACC0NGC1_RHOML|nr:hypothetical protein RHMOL_Rhmol06G0214600 [Rhododendron molle]